MDLTRAKAIIAEECRRRVRLSGGPEVFRHLLRGEEALADAALRELVSEGVLKETVLRVGRLYHYPANEKPALVYLQQQLERLREAAAARPARPAAPGAGPGRAHGERAAVPGSGEGSTPAPTRGAEPAAAPTASVPPAADAPPAAAPAFTGPVRAKKKSELAAEAAAAPPAEGAKPVFTGPVRAKKKSEIAAEAAAAGAAPAAPTSPPPVAGQPTFTGPIKAKKKSELAAEAGLSVPPVATGSQDPPSPLRGGGQREGSAPAPEKPVFTGPVRAKKKSELAREQEPHAPPEEA